MAASTAPRAASKRRFDSLLAEEGSQIQEYAFLHVSIGWSERTCAEFDSLCQGWHVLLHLLISLTAAAAQYLHHVPVDPVSPGQGVPVHLKRAYLPLTNERIIKSTLSESRHPYLNRRCAIIAVPKLSFVSSAHLLVVLQHANSHATLQVVLNILHIG